MTDHTMTVTLDTDPADTERRVRATLQEQAIAIDPDVGGLLPCNVLVALWRNA